MLPAPQKQNQLDNPSGSCVNCEEFLLGEISTGTGACVHGL
jgi:hypothetical protein